jgi:hypothetical protein
MKTQRDFRFFFSFFASFMIYGCEFQPDSASLKVDCNDLSPEEKIVNNCPNIAPLDCKFNGEDVASGTAVPAFEDSAVPFGESCVSESRACSNGALSGSFSFGTCDVGVPDSCLFDGVTIAHGSSVTAYQSSTVPFGQSCQSQARACDNGQLNGTMEYSTCGVDEAASCLWNGQTIAHGGAVAGYLRPNADPINGCYFYLQIRFCNNGTIGGNPQYSYPSCI